jgi:hypothetical protein
MQFPTAYQQYGMHIKSWTLPLESSLSIDADKKCFVPSIHVELDAATTKNDFYKTKFWDTSSVVVFDDIVNHNLRRHLLNVVWDVPKRTKK